MALFLLPLGPPLSGPPPQGAPYGAQRGAGQCLAPAAAGASPDGGTQRGLAGPWAGWLGSLLGLDLA